MNNIYNYILEKLKINKDSKINNNSNVNEVIDYYLNQMIITPDEKYIISEIDSIISDWLKENNIDNVLCHMKLDDFRKTFVEKNKWGQKEDFIYDEHFKKISFVEFNVFHNMVVKHGKEVYSKHMKNQFVKITMFKTNNILYYKDSFLVEPILFVDKKFEDKYK